MRGFEFGFPGQMMGCGPSFGPGFGAFGGALRAQAMRGPFPPPPCDNSYGPFPHVLLFDWNPRNHHHGPHHHESGCHDENIEFRGSPWHRGDGCRRHRGPERPVPSRSCPADGFGFHERGPRSWPSGFDREIPREGFRQCRRCQCSTESRPYGPWRRERFQGMSWPYHPGFWRGPFGPCRCEHRERGSPTRENCNNQRKSPEKDDGPCTCDNPKYARRGARRCRCRDKSGERREKGRSSCEENQEAVLVQNIVIENDPGCNSA